MRALRVGGGEQDAHRPTLRQPKECGTLRARGVHHRAHVVHAVLQRRRAGNRVRKPRAALVEQDQSRERRELLEETRDARVRPLQVEVRDETRHEDEVERTVAHDLKGDVDLPATRVTCLWRHRTPRLLRCARPGHPHRRLQISKTAHLQGKVERVGSIGAKTCPKTASQSRLRHPSQRCCERPAYVDPGEAATQPLHHLPGVVSGRWWTFAPPRGARRWAG